MITPSTATIALIIIITIPVIVSILSRVLDYSRATPKVAGEFTASYLKERYRYAALLESLSHMGLILFWIFGGFRLFADLAKQIEASVGSPLPGLLFGALLMLSAELAGIPFSYYSVFSIEQRYGYNRSSRKTFFSDLIKSLLLSTILAALLFLLLHSLASRMGASGWLPAWAAYSIFSLLLTLLAPRLILPLFNKFRPLEEGEVRDRLEKIIEKSGVSIEKIEVIDGSRRSSKANAFVAGFGKKRRLALYDTFLEKSSPEESEAVLAHELGHLALGHIKKQLIFSLLISLPLFALFFRVLEMPIIPALFGIEAQPGPLTFDMGITLILTAFLFGMAGTWITPIAAFFSRKREYQADRYAKELTGTGKNLADALEKLEVSNGSHPAPHPLSVILRYSHPPVRERVKRLIENDV